LNVKNIGWLVFVEIWRQFPDGDHASILMHAFEGLYLSTMGAISFWFVINYQEQIGLLAPVLQIIIFVLCISVITEIVQKRKIYVIIRERTPEEKIYTPILRGSFFIACLTLAGLASYLSYQGILKIIEIIKG
jgi:hypothetical protein